MVATTSAWDFSGRNDLSSKSNGKPPMPSALDNHDAHDYAERIRERLPRRLQELRERFGLSKYGLARESGLNREYIGKLAVMRRLSRSFTKKNTLGC
jgi:hypothetical protein